MISSRSQQRRSVTGEPGCFAKSAISSITTRRTAGITRQIKEEDSETTTDDIGGGHKSVRRRRPGREGVNVWGICIQSCMGVISLWNVYVECNIVISYDSRSDILTISYLAKCDILPWKNHRCDILTA